MLWVELRNYEKVIMIKDEENKINSTHSYNLQLLNKRYL